MSINYVPLDPTATAASTVTQAQLSQLQVLFGNNSMSPMSMSTHLVTEEDLKQINYKLEELTKKHIAIAKDQEERIVELESVVGKLVEELKKIRILNEKVESMSEISKKDALMQALEDFHKTQQVKAVQTYPNAFKVSDNVNPGLVVA